MVDSHGNVYVGDNSQITFISGDPSTAACVIGQTLTTGYAEGTSSSAQFKNIQSIVLDTNHGENIYVCDSGNSKIRVINRVAFTSQLFYSTPCYSLLFNADYSYLYIFPDLNGNLIQKLIITTLALSVYAGSSSSGLVDGSLLSARFSGAAFGMRLSSSTLIVVDCDNNVIRLIDETQQTVSTLAGTPAKFGAGIDGRGVDATFPNTLSSVTVLNDIVYVVNGKAIREIAANSKFRLDD